MAAAALQSAEKSGTRCAGWCTFRPRLILALAVLLALGPFVAKPFHIDDPLFLWSARHIQSHFLDPYGFDVNWYGKLSPMWVVTKNPPVAGYYLAIAAAVLGWSEVALHCAFLLPAMAVILGTYRLAARFSTRPMFAACATLFTPGLLVSGTTLMCDTLMLAFWVWAIVFWVEGLERRTRWRLSVAGVLMASAALTKYFGICLVPLLAVYTWLARRNSISNTVAEATEGHARHDQHGSCGLMARLWPWAVLLGPIIGLVLYEWAAHGLYGKGLLSDAADYAGATRIVTMAGIGNALIGLTFMGGILAVATFLTPLLWRMKTLAMLAALVAVPAMLIFKENSFFKVYDELTGASRGLVQVQIVFWAIGGMSILGLAAADAWRRRDANSWLLLFWVLGTFVFSGLVNWTVTARSLLPMTPAVGILLARRLEVLSLTGRTNRGRFALVCVAASAALAIGVARADYLFADAARRSAEQLHARYAHGQGTLWFEGHWGFQFYMEKLGANAKAVTDQSRARAGDLLLIPLNNSNVSPPDPSMVHPWKIFETEGPRWLAANCKQVGAGFYASNRGPLPFAFGHVPPERVLSYYIGPTPPDDDSASP